MHDINGSSNRYHPKPLPQHLKRKSFDFIQYNGEKKIFGLNKRSQIFHSYIPPAQPVFSHPQPALQKTSETALKIFEQINRPQPIEPVFELNDSPLYYPKLPISKSLFNQTTQPLTSSHVETQSPFPSFSNFISQSSSPVDSNTPIHQFSTDLPLLSPIVTRIGSELIQSPAEQIPLFPQVPLSGSNSNAYFYQQSTEFSATNQMNQLYQTNSINQPRQLPVSLKDAGSKVFLPRFSEFVSQTFLQTDSNTNTHQFFLGSSLLSSNATRLTPTMNRIGSELIRNPTEQIPLVSASSLPFSHSNISDIYVSYQPTNLIENRNTTQTCQAYQSNPPNRAF